MKRGLFKQVGFAAIILLSAASVSIAMSTSAFAYDPGNLVDPQNPASPLSPLNMSNMNNPLNPSSPLNLSNPANPASPNNPSNLANAWGYGYGYVNSQIVGLAFWTGRPYTYWACQLGVDFQCPSSPNYAYRRAAPAPVAYDPNDAAPPVRHRHRHRRHH